MPRYAAYLCGLLAGLALALVPEAYPLVSRSILGTACLFLFSLAVVLLSLLILFMFGPYQEPSCTVTKIRA